MKKRLIFIILILSFVIISLFTGCKIKNNENSDSSAETFFTVNFIIDDQIYETYIKPNNSYLLQPTIEAREGYIFNGWYLSPDSTEKWDFNKNIIDDNINLYGFWVNENDIYYQVDFFDGEELLYSLNIKNGLTVTELTPHDKFGYSFVGWRTGNGMFDFSEPINSDYKLYAVWEIREYSVTFIADGKIVDICYYTVNNPEINEPTFPSKDFYLGYWEDFQIDYEDIVVNAVYTPITYEATFIVDGVDYAKISYTVEDNISLPKIPEKSGYSGQWSTLSLSGGNVDICAVYTPVTYIATFIANDNIIDKKEFNVESDSITVPEIPERKGYDGDWETFELKAENLTINAIYSPINYIAVFYTDDEIVDTITYNIETIEIVRLNEPKVPEKEGYTAKWSDYNYEDLKNFSIYAIYTPISSSISDPETNSDPEIDADTENDDDTLIIKDEFTYKLNSDGTYTVTGYTGSEINLIIPSTHNDKQVTAIGEKAFLNYNKIVSVDICEGIESIGRSAFMACTSLKTVKLPNSLVSIDGYAFNFSILEDISLPDGLSFIGEYAFSNTNLLSVIIPTGISEISNYLFYNCPLLENVVLTDSVIKIGNESFSTCTSLKNIDLHNVSYIGIAAFDKCSTLITATIDNTADWLILDSSGQQVTTLPKDELTPIKTASLLILYKDYNWEKN